MGFMSRILSIVGIRKKEPDWFRPCHAQESINAQSMGFSCYERVCDAQGRVYLDVLVEQAMVGSIRLTRAKESCIIHRSTKVRGKWQASWFFDGKHTRGVEYDRCQEALNSVRANGMVLESSLGAHGESL